MGGYGVKDHENLGAQFLIDYGFLTRVANLVRLTFFSHLSPFILKESKALKYPAQ